MVGDQKQKVGYMPSFEDFMKGIKETALANSQKINKKPQYEAVEHIEDDQLQEFNINDNILDQESNLTNPEFSKDNIRNNSFNVIDKENEEESVTPSYKKYSKDNSGKFNINNLIDHHKQQFIDKYSVKDDPIQASSTTLVKPTVEENVHQKYETPIVPPVNTARPPNRATKESIPTPNSSLLVSSRKQKELQSSLHDENNEYEAIESTTSDEMYDDKGLITSMVDDLIEKQEEKNKSILELHDLESSLQYQDSPFDDEEIVSYLDQIQKRSRKSSNQSTPQKEPIEILDEHEENMELLGKTLTFRQVALICGLIRGYKTRYRMNSKKVDNWKKQLEDTNLFKKSLSSEKDQNPFLIEQLGKQYARIQSKLISFVTDIDQPFIEPSHRKKALTMKTPKKKASPSPKQNRSPVVTPPLNNEPIVQKRKFSPEQNIPPLYPKTLKYNAVPEIKNESPAIKDQHSIERYLPNENTQAKSPRDINPQKILEDLDDLKKNVAEPNISIDDDNQDDSLSDFHLDVDDDSVDDHLDSVNRIIAERQAALSSPFESNSPMFFTVSQIDALKSKLQQPNLNQFENTNENAKDADTTAKEALLTQMHSRALSLLMDADTKSYNRLLGNLFTERTNSSLPQFSFTDLMNQYGHAQIQPSTIQNLMQYNSSNYLR